MINNLRPVSQPSDVEGVKFRVMQNPVFIDMFRSLGGNTVPIGWAETFTAAQQGMTVNDVSDVAAFREKVTPVYEAFRSSIGEDLFDKTLEAVGADNPAAN